MNRGRKIGQAAEKSYYFIISYVFFIIISALLFMAAFSTTFIDRYEMPYFLPDSPLFNFVFVLIVMLVSIYVYILKQKQASWVNYIAARVEQDEALFLRIRSVLLWAIWFLISLWVVCTQVPANADQRFSLLAARSMAMQDFSVNGPFSYLYIYNNQIGWTLLLYTLNKLFGEMNYVAYQLLNAGIIVFIIKNLSEIGGMLGMNNAKQITLIALSTAFIPLSLYSSFIYGTVPGMWLSLLAIKLELKYFKCGKIYHALFSAIFIALAVMVKMNYLIFMVAMVLYALVEYLHYAKIKKLIIIAFIALFSIAQSQIPALVIEKMSGRTVPEGCSTLSWIVMGLQDGERPGWYNSYNEITFAESDYDAEKQASWMKSDIKLLVQKMREDRAYARKFFVTKTASQWNEPSFASVWISINHYQESNGYDVISVDNEWPKAILSPVGSHILTQCMNYFNFAVLGGAMLWLLLCSKSEHLYDALILPMIFIGGFLFHLVWEVKSQYALPYFVLLLPYTVMGYSKAAECIAALPAKFRGGFAVDKKALIIKLALLLAAIAVLWYVFHGTLGSLTGDSEAYYAYLAEYR